MVKILERLGLAFGADTNASTGFDETIYRLDLPRTDRETLETSLMLLREVAGELTFSPSAIDRERGVILSEERSRDGPAMRAARAASALQFKGQLPPERFPIGEVGNEENNLRQFGKAGAMRWRGVRPTVRGVAMNPVDHPHGGGEGRTGTKRDPVSPWGTLSKGYRTRNNKRTDTMIVQRRNRK